MPVIETRPGVSGPGVEAACTGRLEMLRASVLTLIINRQGKRLPSRKIGRLDMVICQAILAGTGVDWRKADGYIFCSNRSKKICIQFIYRVISGPLEHNMPG